jgi:hypothetical protein
MVNRDHHLDRVWKSQVELFQGYDGFHLPMRLNQSGGSAPCKMVARGFCLPIQLLCRMWGI